MELGRAHGEKRDTCSLNLTIAMSFISCNFMVDLIHIAHLLQLLTIDNSKCTGITLYSWEVYHSSFQC